MHAFVWNSRWWGELAVVGRIRFPARTGADGTIAVGKANIAPSNRHRDEPASDYFVEKSSNTKHNI